MYLAGRKPCSTTVVLVRGRRAAMTPFRYRDVMEHCRDTGPKSTKATAHVPVNNCEPIWWWMHPWRVQSSLGTISSIVNGTFACSRSCACICDLHHHHSRGAAASQGYRHRVLMYALQGHAQETIGTADPKGAPYITSHYAAAAVDCALCMGRIIRSISGALALCGRLVMQVRSESGELRELRPKHTSRTAIIFRTHAV